jgi:anti-sigma factor RsiW
VECREAQRLLEPYLDRELDSTSSGGVEQHLADCPACATAYQQLLNLSRAAQDLRQPLPPALDVAIRSSIRSDVERTRSRSLRLWRATALAACLLAAVTVVASLLIQRTRFPAGAEFADEIVATHVRSLQADHLLDVPSSDQHTVKPWFAGKLDFSPGVRDFADQGYALQGGRLEYLNHRAVAALVYRHAKHTINAYTWPADGQIVRQESQTRQGFHLLRWSDGSMTWCLVSDAGEATLQDLKNLIEQHPAGTRP